MTAIELGNPHLAWCLACSWSNCGYSPNRSLRGDYGDLSGLLLINAFHASDLKGTLDLYVISNSLSDHFRVGTAH
jgi:hypothetical protein